MTTYNEKMNEIKIKNTNRCMTAEITAYPKLSGNPWFNSPAHELTKGVTYKTLCHNCLDVIEQGVDPSSDPHPDAIAEIQVKYPGWVLVY